MKIEKPKGDDTKEFKYLMQAAFQYGYESIFGKSDSEILPEKDIDRDLKSLTRTPKQIWQEIEAMHPNIKVWKTCTPYFDKRNIHFTLIN